MMFAPLEGWRHVKVTDQHTAIDYAQVLKDLADIHFPRAKTIVLVQDNINIHSKASLYEAFPATDARRLVERFEWHCTPSTAVGSIWRNPNSASSPPNALTAAFPTNKPSSTKSPSGSTSAMPITPNQTGASPPKTLALNSSIYTLQSD
jgi:hypothetical protein